MTTLNQLKQYGFLVSPELEEIVKKLPLEIVSLDMLRGQRVAKVFVDNNTDIVITQKI